LVRYQSATRAKLRVPQNAHNLRKGLRAITTLEKDVVRARNAVRFSFLANGIALGSFIARIPDYKSTLAISDGRLGWALIFGSLGVVLSLTLAGRAAARYGSRPVILISTILVGLFIPGVGLLTNVWIFSLALFFWGFSLGFHDISLSSHGVGLEQKSNSKMLSTMHAMYSLGSIIGVGAGGVFAQLEVTPFRHLLFIGILIVLSSLVIRNSLLPADFDKSAVERKHRRKKRPAIIWVLGLLGVCAAIAEGTASDWGGVLARDTYDASPFVSSLPYALFSVLMVIGRLNGDRLSGRFGTKNILIIGGFIAGTGLAAGMLIDNLFGVFFGWFCLGLGVSAVIPLLMSLAGDIVSERYEGTIAPSEAVAMVAGISYLAFLAAPPVIGFLSDAITLRLAILVPAALAIMMAVGALVAPLNTSKK
jgi:MFS family permease